MAKGERLISSEVALNAAEFLEVDAHEGFEKFLWSLNRTMGEVQEAIINAHMKPVPRASTFVIRFEAKAVKDNG